MNLERERELFEAWAYSNKWNIFKVSFVNDDVEKYADDFVEGAWHGWLASVSREGYKLVPVEPTKEISKAGILEYLDQSESRKENGVTTYSFRDIYKAMIDAAG